MKTVLTIAGGVLAGVFAGALVVKVARDVNPKLQELAQGVKQSIATFSDGFKKGYLGEEYLDESSS